MSGNDFSNRYKKDMVLSMAKHVTEYDGICSDRPDFALLIINLMVFLSFPLFTYPNFV